MKGIIKMAAVLAVMIVAFGAVSVSSDTAYAVTDGNWSDSAVTDWYDAASPQTSYTISSAEQLAGLKIGDKVNVMPEDGSEKPKTIEGVVRWIAEEAEFTPKNIQTKDERADLVYAVKITVPNDGSLKLGMYAYVVLK